ncbi:MAG: polysaccharide biosynthesis/export family protein [Litoreibacter sp.]
MKQFFLWIVLTVLAATNSYAQESYRLKPGDTLRIEVLEDSSLSRDTFVLPDGQINFPLVGAVRAGGQTVGQVRATLISALAPNFAADPTVFVSVAALAPPAPPRAQTQVIPETINVYLTGEVNTPGRREVLPNTTLLQFIAEAGGLTQFAATKRLQLRRVDRSGQEQLIIFNYRNIERGVSRQRQVVLQDGDTLVVPTRRLFE